MTAAAAAKVVAVHGFGEQPVAVGIEAFDELIALVVDIRGGFVVIQLFFVGIGLVFYHDAIVAISKQADATGGFESLAAGIGRMLSPAAIGFEGQALRGMHGDTPGAFGSGG